MGRIVISAILFLNTVTVNANDNSKWLEYYANIDTAEVAIVDSIYPKALFYFEKAFKLVDHPFAKDYYNAALCANFLRNFKDATHFMCRLVEKGLDFTYFSENPFFNVLRNSNEWEQFTAAYGKYRKEADKKINTRIKSELDIMLKRDQFYNNKRFDKGYKDSVFIITYRNAKRFIDITNKYGFPDENKIGIKWLPYNAPYYLILVHYLQIKTKFNSPKFVEEKNICLKKGLDFNKLDVLSVLRKAVLEGKYHPNAYAGLFSAIGINNYGQTIMLQVDDTIAEINYNNSIINKLDSSRRKIGLCSLEFHKRKGKFELNKIRHFRPIMKNESPELYNDFLIKNTELADKNFAFGLTNINQNWFYTNKDPQHIQFRKNLELLSNDFDTQ
jgi:hypothetical protein